MGVARARVAIFKIALSSLVLNSVLAHFGCC